MKYDNGEIERIIRNLIKCTIETPMFDADSVGVLDTLTDVGLDSMDLIALVVAIESNFDIELQDEDLLFENLDTIKKIIDIVRKYI